jgi:hypothetical protein
MRNQHGSYPSNAPGYVHVPAHAHFARANGLLDPSMHRAPSGGGLLAQARQLAEGAYKGGGAADYDYRMELLRRKQAQAVLVGTPFN